ncbi:MAG TPA: hypothetical protein VMU10_05655 [Desulfomonilia bacterium]|nr:hypothetical protein [Desulfomonilia bacterium]
MYRKKTYHEASEPKEFTNIEPLFDIIEIMGDQLVRVHEQRKTQEKHIRQTSPDRLIVESMAEFLMTGKFPFRCPFDRMKIIDTGCIDC